MSIETLKSQLPDYAKDLKLNLSSLLREEALTEQQLWGTLLASAIASRNTAVISVIQAEASERLAAEVISASQAAAAVMSMNNIYYRFVHLASDEAYKTMPARLRMNAIANHGVDKADFELWSLAVSAVNGCGLCVESHEQALRQAGVTKETIQAAVRAASVVHAVAVVLETDTSGALANAVAA